ncbi:hypothetical protein DAEQUDRAFT_599736 [Daedalea quercina L-15889]|uniref:Uncharacterized protein n=1 Tax=Daedalea quercina L-15889 TaxID=1314783 RepID=A0A165LQ20_9APHY|nr:hypothetical protein DAEQUDRAFT_599736 [Daedalea quercina L-15889]
MAYHRVDSPLVNNVTLCTKVSFEYKFQKLWEPGEERDFEGDTNGMAVVVVVDSLRSILCACDSRRLLVGGLIILLDTAVCFRWILPFQSCS